MNFKPILQATALAFLCLSLEAMEQLPQYALQVFNECNKGTNINDITIGGGALPVLHFALHDAMDKELWKDNEKTVLKVLSLFMEKGAQPSTQDTIGMTALHFAISCDSPVKAFDMLLKNCGPDVIDDATGDTPLLYVIRLMNDLSPYNEILSEEDDIEQEAYIEEDENNFPSEKFAQPIENKNHPIIITKLLERGANTLLQNKGSETVFHLIAEKNRLDLAQLILAPTEQQNKSLMITMLIKKFCNGNLLSEIPTEILFKVLHKTLPVWLNHAIPANGGSRKKLGNALSIKSTLRKIEVDDETTHFEGGKTPYQIACEKKSDQLAKLLNPENYK